MNRHAPSSWHLVAWSPVGHDEHVQTTSLAQVRAHLSELVDAAEHRGQRILIMRNGKPAAAIVPVDVAIPKARCVAPMTAKEATRFLDRLTALGDPDFPAVDDLLAGLRLVREAFVARGEQRRLPLPFRLLPRLSEGLPATQNRKE